MPHVSACNEIHIRIGGAVYIAYNDIFYTLLPYTVFQSLAHLNFDRHIASMHAYMPFPLPYWVV